MRLKMRFPTPAPVIGSQGRKPRPRGYKPHPNQLRALKAYAVQEGGVLNPHGYYGDSHRSKYRASYFKLKLKPAFRDLAVSKTRLRLNKKKAVALEAHELQLIARENATLAMNTLVEIAGNKRAPEANRIAASAVILDRAYGKASQTSITANVTNGKTKDLDGTELDKRINSALKRVESLTDRKAEAGKSKERPANLRKYH